MSDYRIVQILEEYANDPDNHDLDKVIKSIEQIRRETCPYCGVDMPMLAEMLHENHDVKLCRRTRARLEVR